MSEIPNTLEQENAELKAKITKLEIGLKTEKMHSQEKATDFKIEKLKLQDQISKLKEQKSISRRRWSIKYLSVMRKYLSLKRISMTASNL